MAVEHPQPQPPDFFKINSSLFSTLDCLYSVQEGDSSDRCAATQTLEHFQKLPESWNLSCELLKKLRDPLVAGQVGYQKISEYQFFFASTIAAQCRTGQIINISILRDDSVNVPDPCLSENVSYEVVELVKLYCLDSNPAVLNQLCRAVAYLCLWNSYSTAKNAGVCPLAYLGTQFYGTSEQLLCHLRIIHSIIEEGETKWFPLNSNTREGLIDFLIDHTTAILNELAHTIRLASEHNTPKPIMTEIQTKAINCFRLFVAVYNRFMHAKNLRKVNSGDPKPDFYYFPLFGDLHKYELFDFVGAALLDPSLTSCAAECYIEISDASSLGCQEGETTCLSMLQNLAELEKVVQRDLSIFTAHAAASFKTISPFAESAVACSPNLINFARSLLMALGAFAENHIPTLLFNYQMAYENVRDLLLTAVDCLNIPSLDIKGLALDVYYAFMGNYLWPLEETGQSTEQSSMLQKSKQRTLIPFFQPLVEQLVATVIPYPSNITELISEFDFEAWPRFRDDCALNLTDATLVVGCDSLLELAGGELQHWIHAASQSPASPVPWARVEACLFTLTTVAPRAPAGKDSFIPLALALLPQLNYPVDDPVEGLILRNTSARLILWTAGYVGTQKCLFPELLSLCCEFLEFIAKIMDQAEDISSSFAILTKQAECTVVESITAVTAAAMPLFVEDEIRTEVGPDRDSPSPFLSESENIQLLSKITQLVSLDTLSLDCRCSLLMGVGAMLGGLPTALMTSMHRSLIQSFFNLFIQNKLLGVSVKSACKLFFISIECVKLQTEPPCPDPTVCGPLSSTHPQCHPLLETLEMVWPSVCIVLDDQKASGYVFQYLNHCVLKLISDGRKHAHCYRVVGWFVDKIKNSFLGSQPGPAVCHFESLRTIVRIFYSPNARTSQVLIPEVIDAVIACAENLVRLIKENPQISDGDPDLVGMALDSLNSAIGSPVLLSHLVISERWVQLVEFCTGIIQTCNHNQVVLAAFIFFVVLARWVDRHSACRISCRPSLTKDGGCSDQHFMTFDPSGSAIKRVIQLFSDVRFMNTLMQSMINTICRHSGSHNLLIDSFSHIILSCSSDPTVRSVLEVSLMDVVELFSFDDILQNRAAKSLSCLLNSTDHKIISDTLLDFSDVYKSVMRRTMGLKK